MFNQQRVRSFSVTMTEDGTTYLAFWRHADEVVVSVDHPYAQYPADPFDRFHHGPPVITQTIAGIGEMIVGATFKDAMRAASERWADEDRKARKAINPADPALPEAEEVWD